MNAKVRLKIASFGSHGEGVGKLDNGCTFFVENALPGENIVAELTEQHKRYAKGRLLSIETKSSDRAEPPCPLFGRCGGCQLMHLSYEGQLKMKQKKVEEALTRIGKIDQIPVEPCIASPKTLHYRNKIQLPVQKRADRLSIGLYERGSHNLIEVQKCYIHNLLGEEIYKKLKAILQQANIPDLRHVLIKSSTKTQEALILLVTASSPQPQLFQAAKQICSEYSQVKGVIHNLHGGKENVILGSQYTVLEGTGFITEELCSLVFKVSPASFFQVNPAQAEQLYNTALSLANLKGDETVLDAYCGVGTLSLIFSRKAKKVLGVECVSEAILDARENARLNQIENVSFEVAQAESYIQNLSDIDVVLLNPPRKGCDEAFIKGIGRLQPRTLIYISCDPATLARDLSRLIPLGYRIEKVQPFDMFPQTAHVETLVALKKLSCNDDEDN